MNLTIFIGLSVAYLEICKGGVKPGGLGDGSPPAGSGAEPQNPATFGDFEADFEAPWSTLKGN
jgi:hypothetical protein